MFMSDDKEQGSMDNLAVASPLDDGMGSLLEPMEELAMGGTTGGPAVMVASLELTLTGKESQDSPCADIVRTVSS